MRIIKEKQAEKIDLNIDETIFFNNYCMLAWWDGTLEEIEKHEKEYGKNSEDERYKLQLDLFNCVYHTRRLDEEILQHIIGKSVKSEEDWSMLLALHNAFIKKQIEISNEVKIFNRLDQFYPTDKPNCNPKILII